MIEDDPRCIIQPLDVDIVNMIPTTLEIHDAIITATALIFDTKSHPENVVVLTKDKEIIESRLVKTFW